MGTTRLFLDERLSSGAEIRLGADQARYLSKVLRLGTDDEICVFNGSDGEYVATIRHLGKSAATIAVTTPKDTRTESSLKTHLVQGISRGERMDFVVQKATELGVKRITPVLTEYGVVKLDAKRAAKRRDHWQGVAESACEQSGRIRPPLIDDVVSLNAWFGARPRETDADLILRPGATTSLAAIEAPQTKLCLLIGPEGGFSPAEYDDAEAAGFEPVSLGPRILRTESAALAALAIAQANWGDLR